MRRSAIFTEVGTYRLNKSRRTVYLECRSISRSIVRMELDILIRYTWKQFFSLLKKRQTILAIKELVYFKNKPFPHTKGFVLKLFGIALYTFV